MALHTAAVFPGCSQYRGMRRASITSCVETLVYFSSLCPQVTLGCCVCAGAVLGVCERTSCQEESASAARLHELWTVTNTMTEAPELLWSVWVLQEGLVKKKNYEDVRRSYAFLHFFPHIKGLYSTISCLLFWLITVNQWIVHLERTGIIHFLAHQKDMAII